MLGVTPTTRVNLRCGEVMLYTGKMGRKGEKMAIKIEDRLIQSEEDEF
jgi:flagellar motor switch protein FliM